MGFLDNAKKFLTGAKDKAEDLVDEHGDKVGKGIDKAAELAKSKTGAGTDRKVDSAAGKAKDFLENLDGSDDDDLNGKPAS